MKIIDFNGCIEFEDIIVELLLFEDHMNRNDPYYKRNIHAINRGSKNIKWVVDNSVDDFFMMIRKNKDGSLLGVTGDGTNYNIDLKTGRATRIGWGK